MDIDRAFAHSRRVIAKADRKPGRGDHRGDAVCSDLGNGNYEKLEIRENGVPGGFIQSGAERRTPYLMRNAFGVRRYAALWIRSPDFLAAAWRSKLP